jgi:glycosyltransferase involved in cell wall biosynthesis
VGGTPEVVEDEQTGLLVPFGDVDALERALDRLLADGDLRRRMGIAGRQRLLTHFVFDRFRERLEGYLRELL